MDWIEEARSYLARCYSGVIEPPASLIKRGVEEVRSLREENEELKAQADAKEYERGRWEDRMKNYERSYHAVSSARNELVEQIQRLEKSLSISQQNQDEYWRRMCDAEQKVAGLEKEKAELEERLNRQAKTISEYIDERKEWEKENEILRCIKQSWINRAEEENAKAERLEKEKAELQDINRYINFQFSKLRDERFPIGPPRETETLRDKVASDFANITVYYEWHKFGRCKVADVCEMAYEFADAMMEARKK